MPVYQGKQYLAQAIESIRNQSLQHWELIVIQEAESESGISKLLEQFSQQEPRMRVLKNTRKLGIAASLNRGLEAAEGDFIARMDADDISFPNRLAIQEAYLKEHPEVDILGSNMYHFQEGKGITSKSNYPQYDALIKAYMMFSCPVCHPTVMMRASTVTRLKIRYNSEFCATEDYELWSRIAPDVRFHNLRLPLLKYRDHETNASNDPTKNGHQIMLNLMKRNFERWNIYLKQEELQLLFEPTCKIEGSEKYQNLEIVRDCEKRLRKERIPLFPKEEWEMALDRFTGWARPSMRHKIVTWLWEQDHKAEAITVERAFSGPGIKELLKRKWIQKGMD